MRYILVFAALLLFNPAMAADYQREQKWADEISPYIMVGDPVYLEARKHRFLGIYTDTAGAPAAVILVHGIGVHPDWGLIGVLRSRLAEAGYTTLSIQMPVLAVEAESGSYTPTFDEAGARLQAAVDFLKGKGNRRIVIVSHSLGSRMTNHYLAGHPDSGITAWVAIGISGEFGQGGKLRMPILDLYGANDLPAVLDGAKKRMQTLAGIKGSRQIVSPYTDHFFTGKDDELVRYVSDYLGQQLAR
jgi:dienelactone hydrolase